MQSGPTRHTSRNFLCDQGTKAVETDKVLSMCGTFTPFGDCGAQCGESFSKHLWFAIVIVFLAEMGRIPCSGRPESSSSNI